LPKQVPKNWNDMSDSEKQALRSQKPNWYDHFEWFCNDMKPDDLVIVANGWDSLLGIGRVKSSKPPYEYRRELRGIFFDHVRKVIWERALEYDDRVLLPTPQTSALPYKTSSRS
jgi:predicted Mrr-cat superfamily restriction endonuclease